MATGTYDPTLATALDRVRFAVGDVDVEDDAAIKPDTEYDAVILANDSEQGAIAEMARALAAQVMQDPDSYSESGGISIRWGERIKTWLALADTASARAEASGAGAGMTMGSRATRGATLLPEYGRWHGSWPWGY